MKWHQEYLPVKGNEFRKRFKAKLLRLGWKYNDADMEYEACLEENGNELLDPEIEASDCNEHYLQA